MTVLWGTSELGCDGARVRCGASTAADQHAGCISLICTIMRVRDFMRQAPHRCKLHTWCYRMHARNTWYRLLKFEPVSHSLTSQWIGHTGKRDVPRPFAAAPFCVTLLSTSLHGLLNPQGKPCGDIDFFPPFDMLGQDPGTDRLIRFRSRRHRFADVRYSFRVRRRRQPFNVVIARRIIASSLLILCVLTFPMASQT